MTPTKAAEVVGDYTQWDGMILLSNQWHGRL